MTLLLFNEGVSPNERKRVRLDNQLKLAHTPVRTKENFVRTTTESAPKKRLWDNVQAIFLREKFDIRLVLAGIRFR